MRRDAPHPLVPSDSVFVQVEGSYCHFCENGVWKLGQLKHIFEPFASIHFFDSQHQTLKMNLKLLGSKSNVIKGSLNSLRGRRVQIQVENTEIYSNFTLHLLYRINETSKAKTQVIPTCDFILLPSTTSSTSLCTISQDWDFIDQQHNVGIASICMSVEVAGPSGTVSEHFTNSVDITVRYAI